RPWLAPCPRPSHRRKISATNRGSPEPSARSAPARPRPRRLLALTAALDAKAEATRGAAAEALGQFGPAAKAAGPRLRALLEDRDPSLSRIARAALDRIDPASPSQPPGKAARPGEL